MPQAPLFGMIDGYRQNATFSRRGGCAIPIQISRPGAHAFMGRFRVLGDVCHWRGGVASNMLNQAQCRKRRTSGLYTDTAKTGRFLVGGGCAIPIQISRSGAHAFMGRFRVLGDVCHWELLGAMHNRCILAPIYQVLAQMLRGSNVRVCVCARTLVY